MKNCLLLTFCRKSRLRFCWQARWIFLVGLQNNFPSPSGIRFLSHLTLQKYEIFKCKTSVFDFFLILFQMLKSRL